MRGQEVAGRFWAEVVQPGLEAMGVRGCGAALLGPGSEVLGFDDERSTDHDVGPRLQVVLPEGRRNDGTWIADRLDLVLPERFADQDVRFATTADPAVRHRVEVTTIEALAVDLVGLDPRRPMGAGDWLGIPTQSLAAAVSGVVLADPDGTLAAMRAALAWYPDDVWRYVVACQWRRLAQREAFLGRTAEVGDDLGSRLVAADLCRDLIGLAFLVERVWAPYQKWLGSAFAGLDVATAVGPALATLVATADPAEREAAYLAAGTTLAERAIAAGVTPPLDRSPRPFHDRPFLVLGADRFADAGVAGSPLAALGGRGSIDQWIDSTDVLTEPAARTGLVPRTLHQPTLAAGPFVLRPFAPDDLDLIRDASGDPLIPLITTVPAPFTPAAGRAFVDRQARRAATGEGWSWAIAVAATDVAVGQVGLWPKGDGRATIGYWVVASGRGQGAAGHAVEAVCRFAYVSTDLDRLELHIEPGNVASIRTAERCGFTREGVLRGFEVIGGERRDMAMYARLAPGPEPSGHPVPRRR